MVIVRSSPRLYRFHQRREKNGPGPLMPSRPVLWPTKSLGRSLGLGPAYSCRLHPLRALLNVELHNKALLETSKSVTSDFAVVNEDVRGTILLLDETISLGIAEPFHLALRHTDPLLKQKSGEPASMTHALRGTTEPLGLCSN